MSEKFEEAGQETRFLEENGFLKASKRGF